jgi:hypothetical protein
MEKKKYIFPHLAARRPPSIYIYLALLFRSRDDRIQPLARHTFTLPDTKHNPKQETDTVPNPLHLLSSQVIAVNVR